MLISLECDYCKNISGFRGALYRASSLILLIYILKEVNVRAKLQFFVSYFKTISSGRHITFYFLKNVTLKNSHTFQISVTANIVK
jgi:hypothetical protein